MEGIVIAIAKSAIICFQYLQVCNQNRNRNDGVNGPLVYTYLVSLVVEVDRARVDLR